MTTLKSTLYTLLHTTQTSNLREVLVLEADYKTVFYAVYRAQPSGDVTQLVREPLPNWRRLHYLQLSIGHDVALQEIFLQHFGVLWSLVGQITVNDYAKLLAKEVATLLPSLRATYTHLDQTILYGGMAHWQVVREALVTQLGTSLHWYPESNELDSDSTLIEPRLNMDSSLAISDYFAILSLELEEGKPRWMWLPLMEPNSPLKIQKSIFFAPQLQRGYLFVARYQEVPPPEAVPTDAEWVAAVEINVAYRTTLDVHFTWTSSDHIAIQLPSEPDATHIILPHAQNILSANIPSVDTRFAPIQTIFLVDQAITEIHFRRINRLIYNTIEMVNVQSDGEHGEFLWSMFLYYPLMFEEYIRFLPTSEFVNRIQDENQPHDTSRYKARHLSSRNDPVDMRRIFEHLNGMQWFQDEGNYVIVFAQHPPTGDISEFVNALIRKHRVNFTLFWVGAPEIETGKVPISMEPLTHPNDALVGVLKDDTEIAKNARELASRLKPIRALRLQAEGLPWPLDQTYKGRYF